MQGGLGNLSRGAHGFPGTGLLPCHNEKKGETPMKQRCLFVALALALCGLILSCQPASIQETDKTPTSAPSGSAGLPNPAAVYCQEQGYNHEIRTAADGSQSGVCIFPEGNECDEWAFFRGECGPTAGDG